METLRDKFMTVCTGCDGTGTAEEPYTTFGNETHYRDVVCDCENGKEFGWRLVDAEVKATKEEIESLEVNILALNQIMRNSLDKNNDHVINAFRQLVEYENKISELEEYLEKLEVLE